VPPQVALAVAQRESSLQQYGPDGNVLRGAAGEFGVFQLMPSTAAGCGINPRVVEENIDCGVQYLKQQYERFGSWDLALSAYNAGPANVAKGIIPQSTKNYVADIFRSVQGVFSPEPVPGQYEVGSTAGASFMLPNWAGQLDVGSDYLIPALGLGLAAVLMLARG